MFSPVFSDHVTGRPGVSSGAIRPLRAGPERPGQLSRSEALERGISRLVQRSAESSQAVVWVGGSWRAGGWRDGRAGEELGRREIAAGFIGGDSGRTHQGGRRNSGSQNISEWMAGCLVIGVGRKRAKGT